MKKIFDCLRKDFDIFENGREVLVRRSRDVLKHAKAAIYAGHREDLSGAQKHVQEAATIKRDLDKMLGSTAKLLTVGAYGEALEEYAEAVIFIHYLKTGKLVDPLSVAIEYEIYLQGLCDATGELGRRAVNAILQGKPKETHKIKAFIEEIYGELMQFDFRNSPLRVKFDRVKITLERLEDLALKLHLRDQ